MYTVDLTIDDVINALALFLQPYCGGDAQKIVRGQVNRVPQPRGDCVYLTEILQVDLETPSPTYDTENGAAIVSTPTRIDVQIDFYGDRSGDYCRAVKAVFRSEFATDQFPDGIKPLYCTDGQQHPFVTGEQQYQQRWTLTASLQYNPVVVVPQDSATELENTVHVPVDSVLD